MLHGVCVISKSDWSPLPSAPCSNYEIYEGNDSDHDSPITWSPADSGERAACAITSGYDLDEEKDNEGFYNKIKYLNRKEINLP